MTDTNLGDLGVAAGDIVDRAFTLGYETGRTYIPAGGMALTAEEFADFLNVIWEGRGDYSSRDRLREKFPTSEHDEARLQRNPETLTRIKSALASTDGDTEVTGQDFLDAMPTEPDCWDVCEGHPAPAEPAEEAAEEAAEEEVAERELTERLVEKWTSAMNAARKSEHHFPADCLAEAIDMLHGRPTPAEPAEERRSFPTIQDVPNDTLFHTHGGNGSSLFVRNQSGDLRLCLNAGPEWSKLLRDEDFLPSSGPYVEVPWSKFPQPPADPFAQPAPAEPAEEETKAEGSCEVRSPQGDTCSFPKPGHAGVHTWAWPDKKPASSPVVPAPTETGPWA